MDPSPTSLAGIPPRPSVIDVHCHVGFSAAPPLDGGRFTFEDPALSAGCDAYMAPRMLRAARWQLLRYLLGVPRLPPGPALDEAILHTTLAHLRRAPSVDRAVALAFDQVHDDAGRPLPPALRARTPGTDLYVSNTLVRSLCRRFPQHFLFGASLHPYRTSGRRHAWELLDEVIAAGAVLVKWLPIVQNIDARDPRTVEFLRHAGRRHMPMLIHYGGETALSVYDARLADPRPLLACLSDLHRGGEMPPVIVAHAASASTWPVTLLHFMEPLLEAMRGPLRDAPLYADTAAMALFSRARFLKRLLRQPDIHDRLVFGTDFPMPCTPLFFVRQIGWREVGRIAALPSWIEQNYRLQRALGLDEAFAQRTWRILADAARRRHGDPPPAPPASA